MNFTAVNKKTGIMVGVKPYRNSKDGTTFVDFVSSDADSPHAMIFPFPDQAAKAALEWVSGGENGNN